MTVAAIHDAATFLLAPPLARVVADLRDRYPAAHLAAPRTVVVDAAAPRLSLLMGLLSRCAAYAPVAAKIVSPAGSVLGVWEPKTLIIQRSVGGVERGSEYHLAVGPGAHLDGTLPRPTTAWAGPLPPKIAARLRDAGLLERAST